MCVSISIQFGLAKLNVAVAFFHLRFFYLILRVVSLAFSFSACLLVCLPASCCFNFVCIFFLLLLVRFWSDGLCSLSKWSENDEEKWLEGIRIKMNDISRMYEEWKQTNGKKRKRKKKSTNNLTLLLVHHANHFYSILTSFSITSSSLLTSS